MRFRWGTRGQNINYEWLRQIKILLALFIAAWPLGVNDWVSGPPLWSSVLGWQRLNQDKSKIKTHSAPKKTFYSFVKTNFYRCKPWTIKHGCSLCDITHRFLKSLCQDSSVAINGEISYRGQKCFYILDCKHVYFFCKVWNFNIEFYGGWPFEELQVLALPRWLHFQRLSLDANTLTNTYSRSHIQHAHTHVACWKECLV